MPVRPLNDWILLELLPVETKIGLIEIPNGVTYQKGVVRDTGPGKELKGGLREPTGVEPGQTVVFHRSHGEHKQGKHLVQVLGGGFLLVRPQDIILILDDPEVSVT